MQPATQRALAQASVFRGGFQREALQAVTDATLSELGARAVLSAIAEARAFAGQANNIVASHWPTTVRHAPWPGFCIQWHTNPPAVCSKAPGVKHARLSVVPISLALGNALRAAQLGRTYDWAIIYLGHDETDTTNTRNLLGRLLKA